MIVSSHTEYELLKERMNRDAYISTPIFRDIHLHPAVNNILCLGISFLNGDFYLVSITHPDAPSFDIIPENINMELCKFLQDGEISNLEDVYSPFILNTQSTFRNVKDSNRLVPITQWSTVLRKHHSKVLRKVDFSVVETNTYKFMNKAVETLRRIEQSGLAVNLEILNGFFPNRSRSTVVDNLVYSQYFPYTTTGRPSNRFGSINFAALNKSDGSRKAFISRFENGSLLQIDFESYHLRLIADYMNISLPNEPIHTYLAKQYFDKETISQEEYEEGKQITFGILYGADVETDIPLLNSIKTLSDTVYQKYLTSGFFAPISGRRIHIADSDASKNKLFNYFVQSLEFEATIPKLSTLLEFLDSKMSKLILYTYDAVLLDCHPDEIDEITSEANNILRGGKFPTRTYIGTDYHSLKEIVWSR